MPQTEKVWSAIEALLADNAVGAISPQDVRDAVASSLGGYAGLILSIAGQPVVLSSVAQTAVKITEYDTRTAQSSDANTAGTSASTVTGDITLGSTGVYAFNFYASFSLSGNNKLVTFQRFKNSGVDLVQVARFAATGTDVGSVSMSCVLPYSASDVLDMRVLVDSGTVNITFQAVGMTMFRVG